MDGIAVFHQRTDEEERLRECLAPPPIETAREALDYWRARERSRRIWQRHQRREAQEMALRWELRLRESRRAHGGPLTRLTVSVEERVEQARGVAVRLAIGAAIALTVMLACVIAAVAAVVYAVSAIVS
jgi:hypothetical protein